MKGNFGWKGLAGTYFLSLSFTLLGAFLAIRCALFGLDELHAGRVSSAVFCGLFALGGLLGGICAVLTLFSNRNAYLNIEGNQVRARFGWGTTLSVSLLDIQYVGLYGKTLVFYADGKLYSINGLQNVGEVCGYIQSHLAPEALYTNLPETSAKLRKYKRHYVLYMVAVVLSIVLMFAYIGLCVYLTGGKDLEDFTQADDRVFVMFALAECVQLALLFFCAGRGGRALTVCKYYQAVLLSALAHSVRTDGLDEYNRVLQVKFLRHSLYRLVIFSPTDHEFAYMLEFFEPGTCRWLYYFQAAKVFSSLPDLYEDIDNSFPGEILEDLEEGEDSED